MTDEKDPELGLESIVVPVLSVPVSRKRLHLQSIIPTHISVVSSVDAFQGSQQKLSFAAIIILFTRNPNDYLLYQRADVARCQLKSGASRRDILTSCQWKSIPYSGTSSARLY